MKLAIAATSILIACTSADYVALRGQRNIEQKARTLGGVFEFEDESLSETVVELPTPKQETQDFPVPEVYKPGEEFGLMAEGDGSLDPGADDGTSEGGTGPNEPGYAEGMEPPDADEDGSEVKPDPCEALGADPDPESQDYIDCMEASAEGDEEAAAFMGGIGGPQGRPGGAKTSSYSVQQAGLGAPPGVMAGSGGEAESSTSVMDEMMEPLKPEAKMTSKTVTIEYSDGSTATVMETFPELAVPTESPVASPDPAI